MRPTTFLKRPTFLKRRKTAAPQEGFTLVELLISMSIFALILSLVFGFLIATQKQAVSTMKRLDDIDQAHFGIDSLSRTLRTAVEPAQLQIGCTSCTGPASTATALTSAQSASIQLFANGGAVSGPSLVTYSATYDSTLRQGTLTKIVQPPDAGSAPNFTYTACTIGTAGCLITSQAVVRGLQWPLPNSLFRYYDNTGAELVPATGVSLTATELISVDSIAIALTVKSTSQYNTGPTTIFSRVGLPNSGTNVLPTPAAGG